MCESTRITIVLVWFFLCLKKEHPIVNTLFNSFLNSVKRVELIESISCPMFVQLWIFFVRGLQAIGKAYQRSSKIKIFIKFSFMGVNLAIPQKSHNQFQWLN